MTHTRPARVIENNVQLKSANEVEYSDMIQSVPLWIDYLDLDFSVDSLASLAAPSPSFFAFSAFSFST